MTIASPSSESVSPSVVEHVPTLADLLEDLGGISPARILYQPNMGAATEQDVIDHQAKEGRLFELVDGILVEKAMGLWESLLAGAILAALHAFVSPRKLGKVSGASGMLRLFPDLQLIRMPDVAFISRERLEAASAWGKPVPQLAPDLAVEVLSEGNTADEMKRKRREYFGSGVRVVWMVDPVTRTIDVYTSDVYTSESDLTTLKVGQQLAGGSILPGFSLDLAVLFSELDPYPMNPKP